MTLAGGLHGKNPQTLASAISQVAQSSAQCSDLNVVICSFFVSQKMNVLLRVESHAYIHLAQVACQALKPCNNFFAKDPHVTFGVFTGDPHDSKQFQQELNARLLEHQFHMRLRYVEMCEDGQSVQPLKLPLDSPQPTGGSSSTKLHSVSNPFGVQPLHGEMPSVAAQMSSLQQLWTEAYAVAKTHGGLHDAVRALHQEMGAGRLAPDVFAAWINTAAPTSRYTLLHQIAWHGLYSTHGQELVSLGADPALRNARGETPEEVQRRRRAEQLG